MRSIIFVLSLLIMSVSGSLAEESKLKPEISEFKLDNGLRLVVIPDRRAPVVTHMIWYQAGAADDPVGKSGVAHYLEHLMFKGTTTYQNNEFSTAIAEIGGQENAFTSSDYTAYYQKVSPSALKQMMAFEADRMRNVLITEEVAKPELKVILEERSSRVDSRPSSIMNEFVRTALYVHHPYGVPVIGWEHEIANLTHLDTLAFYEKWYQPWNAIVVVAGDVEAEAVLQDAKDTYGKVVASQPEIERNWVKDPKVVVSKTIEYTDKRVTNPSWSRSFITPSYRNAEDGEAEALDLLAAILGGSVKSRIHQEITLNRQIANSAGAWYSGSSRGPGSFGVYGCPRGDVEIS
ncbi:MAG: pitrilysin family protein [Pseudomonadota bacterium]